MWPVCFLVLLVTTSALTLHRVSYDTAVQRRQVTEASVLDGTTKSCTLYYTIDSSDQDCDYIESRWALTHSEFVAWNPSVKKDCSGVNVGSSYCVEANGGSPASSAITTTPTAAQSPTHSPTLDGTVSNCDGWHFAKKRELCETITDKYGMTINELVKWNPALGDCSGLWAKYWYCISVSSHEPAAISTTTGTTVPRGPVAPGDLRDTIVVAYSNMDKATFIWMMIVLVFGLDVHIAFPSAYGDSEGNNRGNLHVH
ncbi:hypothetical protein G7Z17_g2707 [Cylindrodendrum hubeiense]|uniref:LysM domain-containing protein n=1 Tax=Cylindrodendrum hubeiense TaxID=595255 RepID=A0A9P5HKB0_9HYPO|nr:hypothetical protein G7Z17_g2707 [Cylindrodendrum hubeiense]